MTVYDTDCISRSSSVVIPAKSVLDSRTTVLSFPRKRESNRTTVLSFPRKRESSGFEFTMFKVNIKVTGLLGQGGQ